MLICHAPTTVRPTNQLTNQPPFKITISTGTGKESVWGGGRFDGDFESEADGVDGDDFGRHKGNEGQHKGSNEGQHKGSSGSSRGSGSNIQLTTGGGAFR